MTLPAPLRRWRTELSIFPADIAASLGKLLPSLSALIGEPAHAEHAEGEPDGFAGIARRGPYERLLLSEWALQSVSPLEFLRRASSGEHAFTALQRALPAARRGTVLLLDAGPEQLGACRIVQMALVIVLLERARARGADFGWQHLQSQTERLARTFDQNLARVFLGGRSPFSIDSHALAERQRRFAGHELWVVGGARATNGLQPSTRALRLEETRGDETMVAVTLLGSVPRRRVLSLPSRAIATRLLRNPFDAPTASSLRASLARDATSLLLNPTGARLFLRTDDGAQTLSTTPFDRAKPTQLESDAGSQVIAAGTHRKRIAWLSANPVLLALRSSQPLRRGSSAVLRCPAPGLPTSQDLWPLLLSTSPLAAFFVAGNRSLWRADFESLSCSELARGVVALAPLGAEGGLAAVKDYRGAPALLRLTGSHEERLPLSYDGGDAFLRTRKAHSPDIAVLGYSNDGTRWDLVRFGVQPFKLHQRETLHCPSGERVVQVDATGDQFEQLGLYLLDRNRRALSVVSRVGAKSLVIAVSAIAQVSVASSAGRVAYATESGGLGLIRRSGGDHVYEPRESA